MGKWKFLLSCSDDKSVAMIDIAKLELALFVPNVQNGNSMP